MLEPFYDTFFTKNFLRPILIAILRQFLTILNGKFVSILNFISFPKKWKFSAALFFSNFVFN